MGVVGAVGVGGGSPDREAALVGEGLDLHIPKGYIYFAMGFSVFVELLNLRIRGRPLQPVHLRPSLSELRPMSAEAAGSPEPTATSAGSTGTSERGREAELG